MALSSMPRRERAMLAAAGAVLLYAAAAAIFFAGGRREAWAKSARAFERAQARLDAEKALVADRADWEERLEEIQLAMPVVSEGEIPSTRWKRVVERIADECSFHIVNYGANGDGREEDLGEVWELALEVQYRSSLRRLVEFLHALDTSAEGLFDVRQLEISTKRPGELTGKFTLTCAYKKGPTE